MREHDQRSLTGIVRPVEDPERTIDELVARVAGLAAGHRSDGSDQKCRTLLNGRTFGRPSAQTCHPSRSGRGPKVAMMPPLHP